MASSLEAPDGAGMLRYSHYWDTASMAFVRGPRRTYDVCRWYSGLSRGYFRR